MLLQLGLVAVAFAAAGATERFLLMKPLMGSHVLQKGKLFATVRTFVGLLACMNDDVLLQIAVESK